MKKHGIAALLITLCWGGYTALATWSFDYFGEEHLDLEMKRFNPRIPGLEAGKFVSLIAPRFHRNAR